MMAEQPMTGVDTFWSRSSVQSEQPIVNRKIAGAKPVETATLCEGVAQVQPKVWDRFVAVLSPKRPERCNSSPSLHFAVCKHRCLSCKQASRLQCRARLQFYGKIIQRSCSYPKRGSHRSLHGQARA